MRPAVWLIQRTDAVGGTRAIIEELKRRLAAEGLPAEAVYLRSQRDSIRVRHNRLLSLLANARDSLSLAGRLIRERPRVLVTFTPLLGSTLAPVAHFCFGTRVLATHHLPLSHSSRLTRWLDRVIGSTRAFERIIACAPFIASELTGHPAKYTRKLVVIPNGVPAAATPSQLADSAGPMPDLPDGAKLALAVGRLHPQKNLGTAVRALAESPAWHLMILGEGGERPGLAALAESVGVADRLHMPGALPKEAVRASMLAADAFVLPSRTEGLSLALLEAMSYGLPCVVSDIPQNRYPLELGPGRPAGVILPGDATGEWSAALNGIAEDPAAARQLGLRARALQQEHFSEEGMFERYLAEIRRMLA